MRNIHAAVLAGSLALVALPAQALAPGLTVGGADVSIGITGFVPVICHARVTANSVAVDPGTVTLGELREFCNNAAGYRVVADYSPSLAHATLVVDGVEVPLSDTGSTVVSLSNRPAIDTHDLALAIPEDKTIDGNISFRIEPR